MKSTWPKLVDTISDDTLIIDEGDEGLHPTLNTEGMQVSVTTGHILSFSPERCKGGDIPLEDQEGFESTPPCSQIPRVDPYKRNSAAGNVDERYTALELPTSFYLLM